MSVSGEHSTQSSHARPYGLLMVVVFGIGTVSLLNSGLFSVAVLPGIYPGSDVVQLAAIGLGFALLLGAAYAAMGVLAPRSGADYVIASRVLPASLAFAASFTFAIFSALAAGSLMSALTRTIIPSVLESFTTASKLDLSSVPRDLTSQQWAVSIGTGLVVLSFITAYLRPQTIKVLFVIGAGLGVLAWGLLLVQFANAIPGSFEGAWNNAMSGGSYADHLAAAQNLGVKTDANAAWSTAWLLGFWLLFGYFISSIMAGDVKQPRKNLLLGSWLAVLITAVLVIATTLLVQRVIPPEFLTAESFLSKQPNFSGETMPSIIFYAALLYPSVPMIVIIGVCWVYLTIISGAIFFLFISRLFQAWARDNILPPAMGAVNPRFHSPMLSLFMAALFSLLGVLDASQAAPLLSPLTYAWVAALCLCIPMVALAVFPFTQKEWFKQAPRVIQLKIGPVPLLSLLAGTALGYLLWVVISFFLNPGSASPTLVQIGGVVLIFVIGLMVYSKRKDTLHQQGIEMKDIFSSLPQED